MTALYFTITSLLKRPANTKYGVYIDTNGTVSGNPSLGVDTLDIKAITHRPYGPHWMAIESDRLNEPLNDDSFLTVPGKKYVFTYNKDLLWWWDITVKFNFFILSKAMN